MTRIFAIFFALILSFTGTANADGRDAARTAQCIAASGYWPGAKPSRHYIPADYNVAIRIPAGANVSTDQKGDNIPRPRGPLSCDAVVLVSPNDIDANGMVRQGFFAGCANWGTFAPVYVPAALVTQFPGQDRRLYDPTKDRQLDHLFLDNALWLDAYNQSSCLGGVFDPDGGTFDSVLKLYTHGFTRASAKGYQVVVAGNRSDVRFGSATPSGNADEDADAKYHPSAQGDVYQVAKQLATLRVCPTNPNRVWRGELDQDYEPVCENAESEAELISAQRSSAHQSYGDFTRSLVATGQARVEHGNVYIETTCELEPTLAEIDRENQLAYEATLGPVYGLAEFNAGLGSRLGSPCNQCGGQETLSSLTGRLGVGFGSAWAGVETAFRFGGVLTPQDSVLPASFLLGGDMSAVIARGSPVALRVGGFYQAGVDPFGAKRLTTYGPTTALMVRALPWANRNEHLPIFTLGVDGGVYDFRLDNDEDGSLERNRHFYVAGTIGLRLEL